MGHRDDSKPGSASDWLCTLSESPSLSEPQFSFFWVQKVVDLDALPFAMAPSFSDAPAKSDPRSQGHSSPSLSAAYSF